MADVPGPNLQLDEEIMPSAARRLIRANNRQFDPDSFKCIHLIVVEILKAHPLFTSLNKAPTIPIPEIYFQQFWNSLVHNTERDPPSFDADIDHTRVTFNLQDFRNILGLPAKDTPPHTDFEAISSDSDIYKDIKSLGYLGRLDAVRHLERKNMSGIWGTFFGIINKCLSPKHSGYDQCNVHILRIFHGIAFHRHYDYAAIIWDDILDSLHDRNLDKPHRPFVPYERFFSLIITHMLDKFPTIPKRADRPPLKINTMRSLIRIRDPEGVTPQSIPSALIAYANPRSSIVMEYIAAHPESQPLAAALEQLARVPGTTTPTVQPTPVDPTSGAHPASESSPESDNTISIHSTDTLTSTQDACHLDDVLEPNIDDTFLSTSPLHPISSPHHIGRRSLPKVISPVTIAPHPTDHSSTSQQVGVSSSRGEIAHTLLPPHSKASGIETSEQPPQFTIVPSSTFSLDPLAEFIIVRTRSANDAHLGDVAGTSVVAPTLGVQRGSEGNPTGATTMPTPNMGHTSEASSSVMPTGNLRGVSVTLSRPEAIERTGRAIGKRPITVASPPPQSPPRERLINLPRFPLLTNLMDFLEDPISFDIPHATPSRTQPPPTSEEKLDLLTARVNRLVATVKHTNSKVDNLTTIVESLHQTVLLLAEKVDPLENTCKVWAASLKRKHDDRDDPDHDHHEGEKRHETSHTVESSVPLTKTQTGLVIYIR